MKRISALFILILVLIDNVGGQTKAELEASRRKTLEEISYVDNLIKITSKEKSESLSAVRIIGSKVNLRESVISGMRQEISLVSERIALNELAIYMMESDLVTLKEDYRRAVMNSYKQKKGNPDLVYVLSAKDFNQGYKRIKYLQQITKYRRRQAEVIAELKAQIESTKLKLQNDFYRLSDLKSKEEQQKSLLLTEQQRKQKMVNSLISKEKQLRKELEEKKRIAKKIETEIARLIEEERKKALKTDVTPEDKLISDNFAENKGRLPWPVEKGIITSQFGVHQNAVLKNVQEENIGIEITSSGKINARSVFQGEVARVFAIMGANMTVIVRHGKFYSVYTNLVNIKVKTGDKVLTKQEIGEIYFDSSNNSSILKFMIVETKYQDPEAWLVKK